MPPPGYTGINIKDEVRARLGEKRKELKLKGVSETIAHVLRENDELKKRIIELEARK